MNSPGENRALLNLMTWLSPAFPTGAFAYSHGIEWAVEDGSITDGATLLAWLEDIFRHGAGRMDAIFLRYAHRAAADHAALLSLAEQALATAPARERQQETAAQGAAFILAAAPWLPPALRELTDLPYPVAVGALTGAHAIAEDSATLALLQAFAGNLISAAVRLVPLGQNAGLAVLAALEPTLLAVAAETRAATLQDIGGAAFRADIAAMRHETQYTRLFRS